uniref:Zinc finger, CCHC-type, viral movement protein n=1 Tax=Tanacetum cinerariifolium TaxID=118510 RepID=A0A6L2ME16_TANCI|nr:zinc finger, CCHC-type, viral movement protein [Tanacetum cinerariifolium]
MDYEEFDNAKSFEHLFMAELENAESIVQFDAEDYEENQENPNQETSTGFPKSDIKQYFTFDDVPPSKWRERSIEMLNCCTAELQYYTIDVVIKMFLTRLQGRLRDWYHSLGEYHQLQIQQFISPEAFMKFLGNEAYRALETKNVTIAQTSLGELYQLILNALAKLCNQKKFLAEFERTRKRLGTACDDKYLQIKYKKRSQALIQALNQVEPVDVSDLESLYSLDNEPSDSVLCTIAYLDLSSDDDSDTDSLEGDSDFGVHMINPISQVLPIQEDPPLPLAKIHLLTDAFVKPILVIAFFDTGSSKNSLFQHLANAKVLSMFDLKSGFWQLGIKPEDRPKTAFCIPDHHYQWKSHAELLSNFYSLVTKYGIMLSEKKMEVGVTTIHFLGMEISDGKYQPQPHVAQELLKFLDELSSQRMIQQFLGLVNYMADFLPKLSHHTAWLFPMLKKNPPQWTSRQTDAVKAIKSLAEKMPPQKKESYRHMQVMSVGERSYLFRIIIIKDSFVDTKVARSKHLRNTITPRSKKSLQLNEALRSFSFI